MSNGSPLATPMPWDLVSSAYECEVAPMLERYADDALRLAAPPPGARIVDVACGPGTLAIRAARAGFEVHAVDFSPRMIGRLSARILGEHLTSITPRVGDGELLSYAAGRFAAGFSMFGLMFFADRARGFAELRRVLAPGARAVISSWHPMDEVPPIAIVFEAVRDALAAIAPTGTTPAPDEAPLSTADACRTEMSAVFDDVQIYSVSHTTQYPSTLVMWQSIQRTMAPIALVRDKLGPRWAGPEQRVREALTRAFGEGAVELTMPAWLSVGTAR
jgi:SAM-dependent methyltransferase